MTEVSVTASADSEPRASTSVDAQNREKVGAAGALSANCGAHVVYKPYEEASVSSRK